MHDSLRKPTLIALGVTFLLTGCVVPGAPYDGVVVAPQGPPPPPVPSVVIGLPPVVIAPFYVRGYGYGYWHQGHYWPYRRGCHFYNGRYYGGGYRGYRWH